MVPALASVGEAGQLPAASPVFPPFELGTSPVPSRGPDGDFGRKSFLDQGLDESPVEGSLDPPDPEPTEHEGLFSEVVEAFDRSFEALVSSPGLESAVEAQVRLSTEEQLALDGLFAEIASQYILPVHHFITDLRRGTATTRWIDLCRSALQSLQDSALQMGLESLVQNLVDFDAALEAARSVHQRLLSDSERDELNRLYRQLEQALPKAFCLSPDAGRCEEVILRSLLNQGYGLGPSTLQKIYAAGLGDLRSLLMANPGDLSAATGISSKRSAEICRRLGRYRSEVSSLPLEGREHAYLGRLAERVEQLRCCLERQGSWRAGFTSQTEASQPQIKKERQRCWLEVQITLAELGQIELIQNIQRLSYQHRMRVVERYLAKVLEASEQIQSGQPLAQR